MGKGTNTTTNETTTAPTQQAMTAYGNVLNQAQGVAATPYQAYTGELTAPVNAEQTAGIAGVNQYANSAQPYIQTAATQTQADSQPLTAAQIQQYESPYTQQVVNATQAQFNNQNQQQAQGVTGNAIAQGALGGNRTAVAQSELANQQQLAQAPVIAGLENQGYAQGVSTAENQQQAGLQGAAQYGNLGVAGQTAGLTGAGAQIAGGTLQQQTQQAQDTALLQQYQTAQAYPFQTTQWLAGLDTGVGSQMGGTSSGSTTSPAPSVAGQIAGGLTSGVGLLGATGAYGTTGWLTGALAGLAKGGVAQHHEKENMRAVGRLHDGHIIYTYNHKGDRATKIGLVHPNEIVGRARGGLVKGYASGGSPSAGVAGYPWAGGSAQSWVPTDAITHGSGAPHASAPAAYQPPNLTSQAASIGSLAKTITDANNGKNPGVAGTAVAGDQGPSSYGGSTGPTPLVGAQPYGGAAYQNSTGGFNGMSDAQQDAFQDSGGFARGGVAGFADGGDPTFDDRFNASFPAMDVADASPPSSSDDGVLSKDDPVRLDPDADEKWRKGNPVPPLGVAPKPKKDDDLPDDLPVSAPSTGHSKGVAPTNALALTDDPSGDNSLPDEVSLGYSAGDHGSRGVAPSETPSTKGFDWGSDNKLWPSLMSAGFGMLSNRSPFLANAIGAGGEAGMAQYAAETKAEQEAKQHADQLQLERERLERPYSEMTASEKAVDARAKQTQQSTQINQAVIMGPNGKPMVNPDYVAAHQAVTKDWQPKLTQVGVNVRGDPVQGIYDPNTKKATDINGNPLNIVNGIVQNPTPTNNAPSTPPGNPEPQSSLMPKPAGATASNTPYAPVASADAGQVPLSLQKVQAQAGYQTPPAAPHEFDPTAPIGSEASRNTKFLAETAEQDPAYALAIKKAADYELDPGKYASMLKGHREHFINDVLRYDPNYNPQNVGLTYKAQAAFLPGTKTGDTVRSFNTAVAHLDTLKEAYKAVNNGDWQTFNSLKNRFQAEFGYSPPNTLNAIAQIVGGEVVKATVGAQNALGDREELRKALEPKLSQGQALDVIDHFQQLMGGQLHSLKFAYEQGTGLHNFDDKYLLPRSRQVLKQIDAEQTSGGHVSLSTQDKQAMDWANANPNDPRAAAIKKKLGQ